MAASHSSLAGSGIGAGCARRLAAEGSSVVVADVDGAAAERVAAEIGAPAAAMTVDVRDPAAVDDLVAAVAGRHGRLDVALNIAGIAGPSVLPAEFPVDGWREVIDVNLSGDFFRTRAELNTMLDAGRGSIINMASIYGLVGYPVGMGYTAAKHGVVGITRSAALAYAGQGIRINAVAPAAVIETPLLQQAPLEVVATIVAMHPVGRVGQIAEVAEMAAFLASDRSRFCTGGVYPVDGAYTAGRQAVCSSGDEPLPHDRGPPPLLQSRQAAARNGGIPTMGLAWLGGVPPAADQRRPCERTELPSRADTSSAISRPPTHPIRRHGVALALAAAAPIGLRSGSCTPNWLHAVQ